MTARDKIYTIQTDEVTLRGHNEEVEYEEGASICDNLWAVLAELNEDDDTAIGIAAPQIGINKKVAVIKHPATGERIDLINPRVESKGGIVIVMEEGCLSIPGKTFRVPRYSQIALRCTEKASDVIVYADMNSDMGETARRAQERLLCQALQHELDHLEGRLLTDYEDQESLDPWIIGVNNQLAAEYAALMQPKRPYVRSEKKIGRNELCPCGSGKKYKKCCMKASIDA